jgi:hypothetical protein
MRALALVCFCFCACASVPRPAASPWSALATADVEAAHRIILDDHPGPVDAENPGFSDWLEGGYRTALAAARGVDSFGGYVGVLRRYVAGFRDGHLGLSFRVTALGRRWPGFTVGRRGEDYVVKASLGEPPVGAVLVGCDGRSPADLMSAQVFPFAGDPRLEAEWFRLAPSLFVDTGNPLRKLPERCDFRDRPPITLAWTEIDLASLGDKLTAAAFGAAPEAGVRELADGTIWVSLPSFSTDGANAARLKPIIARATSWRGAPRVVFDVRGNSGGSSTWGSELAAGLWGEGYVTAARQNAMAGKPPITVDWRASSAVQAHVEQLAAELGPTLGAETQAWLATTARGIAEARAAKRPYYTEKDDEPVPAAPVPLAEPLTHARVFFVTDGRCASACLDFGDVLLRIPGVVHVGLPTSADTQYMEVRPAPLPSGVAVLNLATKVWRNRPRANNPYVPAHRFPGDIADTAALEAWVRGL